MFMMKQRRCSTMRKAAMSGMEQVKLAPAKELLAKGTELRNEHNIHGRVRRRIEKLICEAMLKAIGELSQGKDPKRRKAVRKYLERSLVATIGAGFEPIKEILDKKGDKLPTNFNKWLVARTLELLPGVLKSGKSVVRKGELKVLRKSPHVRFLTFEFAIKQLEKIVNRDIKRRGSARGIKLKYVGAPSYALANS